MTCSDSCILCLVCSTNWIRYGGQPVTQTANATIQSGPRSLLPKRCFLVANYFTGDRSLAQVHGLLRHTANLRKNMRCTVRNKEHQ
jgi:hypothetical protein